MFVGEIGEWQKELSEVAVSVAREGYGFELDFSHKSIEDVETVLSSFHEEFRIKRNEDDFRRLALAYGFYIAATIQKITGEGVVKRDHPELGEHTFPFFWRDAALFTYAWCEKRIYDGDADNIVTKYKHFFREFVDEK